MINHIFTPFDENIRCLNLFSFSYIEDKESADLWLLNSCTVKTPSEDGFKNFVKEAKSRDKYVVVAGCVPQADRSNKEIQGISVVGVS